jgi:hypothetical protein
VRGRRLDGPYSGEWAGGLPYPFRFQMAKVEQGEVRRITLPRTSVNKGKRAGAEMLLVDPA